MKTKITATLAAFMAMFLVSCNVAVPGGTVRIGQPRQQGGYPPQRQYAENGHSGPPGDRQRIAQEDREVFEGRSERPWGQQTTTKQEHKYTSTQGFDLQIQSATSGVAAQVKEAVGKWCVQTHHQPPHVWPSRQKVSDKIKEEFASRGHNLVESDTRGPGVFILVKYTHGPNKVTDRGTVGEPVIESQGDVFENQVPPEILEQNRQKMTERNQGTRTYKLGQPIPYPNM